MNSTPFNTPCNTTILTSIRLDGRTAHTVYQGGTTAERFAEYLENTLMPTLSKDDIIVMDNMRSHHAKAVKEVLDASGIRYLYLPPYSPDLNPIEKIKKEDCVLLPRPVRRKANKWKVPRKSKGVLRMDLDSLMCGLPKEGKTTSI